MGEKGRELHGQEGFVPRTGRSMYRLPLEGEKERLRKGDDDCSGREKFEKANTVSMSN